jgi:hypothetical protein
MIHKLENGDKLKILPFITSDGVKWGYKHKALVTKRGRTIYDINGYLSKAYMKYRNDNIPSLKPMRLVTRYAFNVYIDGEIKIINIGQKLMDIIVNSDKNALLLKDKNHLIIVKDDINTTMGPLPNYDKSHIAEYNWICPVNDIDSKFEWISYIKSNQPRFIEYVEENSEVNRRKELMDEFGFDIIAEFISEERERKLEKILN